MHIGEDKWSSTDAENEFLGMFVKIVGRVGLSDIQ